MATGFWVLIPSATGVSPWVSTLQPAHSIVAAVAACRTSCWSSPCPDGAQSKHTLDASDGFAQENLRLCREKISKATAKPAMANNRFNRTVRKRPAG
jgi:hypothetical protein